jgi:F-type H+-transporting ATPase subunit gamma
LTAALLPHAVYFGSCPQEALASELAARMNAMNSASDNAKDLRKRLTRSYNRVRQAKITSQIIEICSGAQA